MKCIFLCLLVLVSTIGVNAQGIFPMENSERIYSYIYEDDPEECLYRYTYYFEGDSIVNGGNYFKLFGKEISSCGDFSNKFIGLLEQDSLIVNFIPKGKTEKQLLYDFSLEVGDTIKGYLQDVDNTGPLPKCYTLVENIKDTMLLDGLYHKKWGLATYSYDSDERTSYDFNIIEGIGSDIEFLNFISMSSAPSGAPLSVNCICGLTCFITEEVIYSGDYFSSSYCQDIIDAVKNYSYKPILSPNPVENFIDIGLDEEIESLEVYDIQGRLVLRDENPRSVTDVSFLKSGLYFMKVKTKDMTYLNKMVKE